MLSCVSRALSQSADTAMTLSRAHSLLDTRRSSVSVLPLSGDARLSDSVEADGGACSIDAAVAQYKRP